MTQKTYIEKVKRLETLLKSQNIYDYMLKLMGVMVKNTLPKEEATRKQYDAERLKNIGKTHCYHLISCEKKELVDLIKSNHLVKHYALWKVGADYGTGEVEDYIDIRAILDNLYYDTDAFLSKIDKVEVVHE